MKHRQRSCRAIEREVPGDVRFDPTVSSREHRHVLSNTLIVEGANGTTTSKANDMLYQNGVFTVPDISANAGGVLVPYFVSVQSLRSSLSSEDEASQQLRIVTERAFHEVQASGQQNDVDIRNGAHMLATSRTAEATKAGGMLVW